MPSLTVIKQQDEDTKSVIEHQNSDIVIYFNFVRSLIRLPAFVNKCCASLLPMLVTRHLACQSLDPQSRLAVG